METVGGNGVTGRSAYMIQQLAEQLKGEGEITETEYQDLIQLSKLGFRMQDVQKVMEASLPSQALTKDNVDNFVTNTMVTVEGQRLSYADAGRLITMTGTHKSVGLEYINPAESNGNSFGWLLERPEFVAGNKPSPMVKEFFDLLVKIQNSPSFQNKPVLKDLVVSNLSKEIYRSTSMTGSTFDKGEIKNILIPITGQNSEAICDLSNSISCQRQG